ncbi:MAG: SDR family NAD(P)-dependent oxidoreductase [Pseudomonadales bacterium]
MTKIAIVTGGSNGIGLACCQQLIAEDYHVCNLDITPSECGEYWPCDVSDFEQVTYTINAIAQKHRQIDALVCNAGKHLSGTIENTSEQALDALFSLNVKGAIAAISATLPSMKSANSGAIVIIGSDQSTIAKPNSFAYNLTKHALASLAKTTALDYAAYNIRANAVCPGTIETPLYHQAIDNYCQRSGASKAEIHAEEEKLQPLGRLGQADEVAQLVCFLASNKASFITGSLHPIDGGYTTG